jgi:predicted SprT family Zn-dependent metalloprotease
MRKFTSFLNTIMKNNILIKYLETTERASYVETLLYKVPNLSLYIKNPRKTKYGTMVFSFSKKRYYIIINNNLSPEFFLYVFLHEYAHVLAHLNYGKEIKPHGKIWQDYFFSLLKQAIEKNLFSIKSSNAIKNQFLIPNIYSKQRDILIKNEMENNDCSQKHIYLKNLSIGDVFTLNNQQTFRILKKIRTRYLCEDVNNGTLYKISGLLKIK